MLILFPKRKGIKIATTILFELIETHKDQTYIQGAIDFARAFGAITEKEQLALCDYLKERVFNSLFFYALFTSLSEPLGAPKAFGVCLHLEECCAALRGAQSATDLNFQVCHKFL